MDSASTTESNNQLKSRSQHEPANVEELHSFPKLPVELQREIWRLAVPPKVIRLQLKNYGESNLVGYRDSTLRLSALIPEARVYPLLLVCRTSRQVMLAHRGQEYHLSKEGDVFGNVISGLRTQFSFDFDFETDTISFTDWKHFEHFTRHYELFSSGKLRPTRSSAVKSITLEHIEIQELDIKDITYYAGKPSDRRWHTKIWEILDWSWGAYIPSLFYEFPDLEELILIDFKVKPAGKWAVYDRPHLDDMPRISREWVPATEEDSVRMFVETFEHALKWQAPESVLGRSTPPAVQAMSKWWQDPRVTRMARGEFQRRFY
jgi:hypothetical protein